MTTPAAPPGRAGRRLSRVEAVLLVVALALSVAILVGAFVVPIGSGDHAETLTVADESGLALLVCVLPLIATLVVGSALWRRGGTGGLVAAWIALGVLGLAMLVSILSIGFALFPVVGCLFVALVVRVSHVDPPVPASVYSTGNGAPGAHDPPPA